MATAQLTGRSSWASVFNDWDHGSAMVLRRNVFQVRIENQRRASKANDFQAVSQSLMTFKSALQHTLNAKSARLEAGR